jgi:epoxyqueuosine reductase QueG
MKQEDLEKVAADFLASAANIVPPEKARDPRVAGMRIYDEPLLGFADADDEYIAGLGSDPAAGIKPLPPREWLAEAQTIIAFFLPFTQELRRSNRGGAYPSPEWMNGRIEGQTAGEVLSGLLREALTEAGHAAVVPGLDKRFWSKTLLPEDGGPLFTSNWSERHAAYACGLGTFSLSKAIITRKGAAGRFGSLITSLKIPATKRPSADLYGYCSFCGACVKNCPVDAIDKTTGKDHVKCSRFLNKVRAENAPYYGCGKCQTATPCEAGIPEKR